MNKAVERPGPGTPVTVVGMMKSGLAAARWLLDLGCAVRVTEAGASAGKEEATHQLMSAGAQVELGRHTRESVRGSQLLVVSPGVPLSAPPVKWARENDIPVVSELELGSWYCPGRMVAVTGSNGKSTVVTLLGQILKAAGREVVVCGNIGIPFTQVLPQIRPSTFVVLEVSSFQLETSLSFHTEIACVLNVTDNHLDRHGSFDRYKGIKAKIFAYQPSSSWALLNADDPGSRGLSSSAHARLVWFSRRKSAEACAMDGWLKLGLPLATGPLCRRDALFAQGSHHEENALAAACMAGLLGVEAPVIGTALAAFEGLPHRQQLIATIGGISFINDSKSTTVASGLRAIEAAPGRVVLIAGGRDKGSDFRQLIAFQKKLKAAVLIGEDGPKISLALQGKVNWVPAKSLKEAVHVARDLARPGEWVLLSPMCTSFDMFRDFEERGEHFSECVRAMKKAA